MEKPGPGLVGNTCRESLGVRPHPPFHTLLPNSPATHELPSSSSPSSPGSGGKLLGPAEHPTEPSTPWKLGLFCSPLPQRGWGSVCASHATVPTSRGRSLLSHTCVRGLKRPELQGSIARGSRRGGDLSGWCGGRNHASHFLAKNSFLQTRHGKKKQQAFLTVHLQELEAGNRGWNLSGWS